MCLGYTYNGLATALVNFCRRQGQLRAVSRSTPQRSPKNAMLASPHDHSGGGKQVRPLQDISTEL